MRIFSYIFTLIILLLGVSFACLNAELVDINYYVGSSKLPLSVVLVMAVIIGAFAGLLVAGKVFINAKREQRRLNQRIKVTEKEIENLRVMPLKDGR